MLLDRHADLYREVRRKPEPNGDLPERTARHRFRRVAGLSRRAVVQLQRAEQAATLLAGGIPIAEVAATVGFSDQSHLTRVTRRWLGHTPGELAESFKTAKPDAS